MRRQICERCGTQFNVQGPWPKVGQWAISLCLVGAAFFYWTRNDLRRAGVFLGAAVIAFIALGVLRRFIGRSKRTCPSCGHDTVSLDSPLGKQLVEKWGTPAAGTAPPEVAPDAGAGAGAGADARAGAGAGAETRNPKPE